MSSLPPSIAEAYDPERFRRTGHELIDAMADALARWQRRDGLVLPWRAPDDALAMWSRKGFGGSDLVVQLRRIMASSTALYHPRCMGHQVPPPLPGAALAELVSALLNNGMAVYEMGPAVGTQLPGGYFLRSTIMNPLTEPSDFDDLLGHLRELCRV